MSNHLSAANLKFPGDDARLDLTDVFAFPAPGGAGRTVLAIDVNPFMTAPAFHPDAIYRINVDTDRDSVADLAFSFVFTDPDDGTQTATVHRARGAEAQTADVAGEVLAENVPVGFGEDVQAIEADGCRLFIGVRSDPFFADIEGVLHEFNFTGADAFAGKNVLSIVLEGPDEQFGTDAQIGIWATVTLRTDGSLVQMDRGGHPSLTAFFNAEDAKAEYNARQPADDEGNYLETWSQVLQNLGKYSPEDAQAALATVLPDILRYDRSQPAAYPNGRTLTDDVFDARLAFVTNGAVTADGVGPHTDLLDSFPYLGAPNPAT